MSSSGTRVGINQCSDVQVCTQLAAEILERPRIARNAQKTEYVPLIHPQHFGLKADVLRLASDQEARDLLTADVIRIQASQDLLSYLPGILQSTAWDMKSAVWPCV